MHGCHRSDGIKDLLLAPDEGEGVVDGQAGGQRHRGRFHQAQVVGN